MNIRRRLMVLATLALIAAIAGTTAITARLISLQAQEQARTQVASQLEGASQQAYTELNTQLLQELVAAKYLAVSMNVIAALVNQSPGTVQDDLLEPQRRIYGLSFVSLVTPDRVQVAQAKAQSLTAAQVTRLPVLLQTLQRQQDTTAFWNGPREPYAVAATPVWSNTTLVGAVIVGKLLDNSSMSQLSHDLGTFQLAIVRDDIVLAASQDLLTSFANVKAPSPYRPLDLGTRTSASLSHTDQRLADWRVGTDSYAIFTRPLYNGAGATTLLVVASPEAAPSRANDMVLTPLAAGLVGRLGMPAASTFAVAVRLTWVLGLLALFLVLAVLTGAGVALALRPAGSLAAQIEGFLDGRSWPKADARHVGPLGQLDQAVAGLVAAAANWRQRLGEQEDRLESVLNSMRTGVVVSDTGGHVELINPTARQLLGIEAAAPALPVPVPADRGDGQQIQAVNGRVLNAISTAITRRDGQVAGLVTVLDDLTRERELERVRSDFLSVVSHELRTPLTAIKGSLDLLLDGEAGDLDRLQQRFLHTARRNTERLIALVNDLLDLSRLEAGQVRLNLNPADVRRIVDDVVVSLSTLFDGKRQEVSVEAPPRPLLAMADRRRLEQVLTNLLANAAIYTPEEGHIWVSATAAESEAVLTVRDSGPGIAREDREHLFEKFYRGGNALTRQDGGTGLGLAIVKSLVELHHGTINVESEPGNGATFIVRLPLAGDRREDPSGG